VNTFDADFIMKFLPDLLKKRMLFLQDQKHDARAWILDAGHWALAPGCW
jgi:hypothetical protein